MSDRQTITKLAVPAALGGLFLLSGCSTVQENPNYQFSSKYETSETVTVTENTPTTAPETVPIVAVSNNDQAPSPTEEAYTEEAYNASQMIGTPGYAILLAEQAQERENAAMATATPTTAGPLMPAPDTSTPAPAADIVQAPRQLTSGPRKVAYDYAQNVIVGDGAVSIVPSTPIPEPIAAAPSRTPISVPTARTYVVQPGDTVYSLSRRLCTPITDIMTANGIETDFAIDIGQTLTLPASLC